jgi:hypothetical protein
MSPDMTTTKRMTKMNAVCDNFLQSRGVLVLARQRESFDGGVEVRADVVG